jgi:hypothetical protein
MPEKVSPFPVFRMKTRAFEMREPDPVVIVPESALDPLCPQIPKGARRTSRKAPDIKNQTTCPLLVRIVIV